MSRPIEQVLNNLIPRHSGALPPELIELASSLLTQSRSKISNLRAEEEIGRTYACANIACERLKTSLNLPTIEPRPPCAPKVYKKLYGHFDQILASSSTRRKPRASAPTPAKVLPLKPHPAKEKSLEGFRSNRAPKRGLKYASNIQKERLPAWVGPVIRRICKEFDTGLAVPHVWAGVESVLYLPCPREGEGGERLEGKIPALLAAVWFHVVTRLTGKAASSKEYRSRQLVVLDVLQTIREDEEVLKKVGNADEDWKDWEPVTRRDVDGWLAEIGMKGWNEMEWMQNIEEGSGVSGTVSKGPGVDEEMHDAEDTAGRESKQMRRAGLGTMIQPKNDYLSEEYREEYAAWKGVMMAKIEELLAEGIMDDDDMDLTEG